MIRCKNLSFEYLPERPILQNISLQIEPGTFTFLKGASGAGKSSLLGLLSLSLQPTQGTLSLFGQDVTHLPHHELPDIRRKIGTVFQDYQLLSHLSVAENVGLPLKVAGESDATIKEKVNELMDWVGLDGLGDMKPNMLSGGQKQRAAIARAVINKPLLILADEPTGNLDHELSMRFMYLFRSLNKIGTTILFATHDDTLISHFDYPVLHLRDGQIARPRAL